MTYDIPNPAPAPRRRFPVTGVALIAGGVALLLCLCMAAIGAATGGGNDNPAAPSIVVTTGDAPATTKATPPPGAGAGTYLVGEDIKAGTYRTTVPADEINCYWARLRDLDGSLNSTIDNGNLRTGAKGVVVIKRSDKAVEFIGSCLWRRS